ncbi:hypothetical protein NBRC116590_14800 [Pelagimonas sp. KU-00592-HH]|jgi:hypothetical protein|uniref:hypothetical protein n=1 Tax=Roseobacteraceae TaxID=2854170 RepID=UPI0020CD4C64|nr:hypothetical protein [Shimia sp. CNT1-13L.2]MCP9483260.1 hypothetical protein [Shimia sp. CNT1-13L.2]
MNEDEPDIEFRAGRLLQRIDMFLASQGMGFNAGTERRRRLHEAYALDALSDCELAYMGMNRADIPAFVFADLLGGGAR